MAKDITASPEQLYADGRWAAQEAFKDAVATIDKKFGEGYAKENPALVGAYLSAAATAGAILNHARVLDIVGQRVGASLESISNAITLKDIG